MRSLRQTKKAMEKILAKGQYLVDGSLEDGKPEYRLEKLTHKLSPEEVEEQCRILDKIMDEVEVGLSKQLGTPVIAVHIPGIKQN